MLSDNKLGKLTVDLNANTNGLKTGMTKAKSVLTSGIRSMSSALSGLKLPLLALGTLIGVGLTRSFKNFLSYSRQVAVLENTFKKLNKNSKATFADMQKGMLDLARITGISSKDQTEALQVMMRTVGNLMTPQDMQNYLLPIAADWAAVSGKTLADAAKDIAESWMGEIPEELLIPVRTEYEEANPGKKFDDLARADKWKALENYMRQFEGAAEASANNIGGAFVKIKIAFEELMTAIYQSGDFAPLISKLTGLSDSIFNLAERIKNGDAPGWLLALQEALVSLWDKIKDIDWEGVFKWLSTPDKDGKTGWDKIAEGFIRLGSAILVFKTVIPIINGLITALTWLLSIVTAIVTGSWLIKLGNLLLDLASKFSKSAAAVHKGVGDLGDAMNVARNPFYRFSNELAQGNGLMSAFKAGFGTLGKVMAGSTIVKTLGTIAGGFKTLGGTVASQGLINGLKQLPALLTGAGGAASGAGTAVTTAAAGVTASAGTIAAGIAIIIGLIIGFVAAWKGNWDGLKDKTHEVFASVGQSFKDLYEKSIKPVVDKITEEWNNFIGLFKKSPDDSEGGDKVSGWTRFLERLKKEFGMFYNTVIETIGLIGKTIANTAGVIIEGVQFVIDLGFGPLKALVDSIVLLFQGKFKEAGKVWKNWAGDLSLHFSKIIGYLGNFLGDIIKWGAELVSNIASPFQKIDEGFEKWRQGVKDWGNKAVKDIKDWCARFIQGIKDLFGIKSPSKVMAEIGDNIGQGLFNGIKAVLATFGKLIDMVVGFFTEVKTNVTNFLNQIGAKLTEYKNNVVQWVSDNATAFSNWVSDGAQKLGEFFSNIGTFVKDSLAKFGEFVTNTGTKLGEWVQTCANKLADMLSNWNSFGSNIKAKFGEIVSSIGTFAGNTVTKLGEWVGSTWTKIGEYIGNFKDLPSKIGTALSGVGTAIKNGLSGGVESVKSSIQALLNAITDMASRFWTAGSGLFSSLWNGMKSAWTGVSNWFTEKLQNLRDLLPGSDAKKGPLSTLTKAGRGLFSAMQDGASSQFGSFMNDVTGYAGRLRDGVSVNGSLGLAGASGSGQVTIQINGGVYTNERDFKRLAGMIDEELGRQRAKR